MKIKINIAADEEYPVYSVYCGSPAFGNQVEIDLKTYQRWKKTILEFQNVQKEMVEVLVKAGHTGYDTDWIVNLWKDY